MKFDFWVDAVSVFALINYSQTGNFQLQHSIMILFRAYDM
jgi:hypothetical protein